MHVQFWQTFEGGRASVNSEIFGFYCSARHHGQRDIPRHVARKDLMALLRRLNGLFLVNHVKSVLLRRAYRKPSVFVCVLRRCWCVPVFFVVNLVLIREKINRLLSMPFLIGTGALLLLRIRIVPRFPRFTVFRALIPRHRIYCERGPTSSTLPLGYLYWNDVPGKPQDTSFWLLSELKDN